jgi:hypothetical protein
VDTGAPVRVRARLTVRHLWVLVPVLGAAFAVLGRVTDNSFLWHVRAGTLQLDTGEVLRADPFSFTMAGTPWRTQSWLAELAYGGLERATGSLVWVTPFLATVGIVALALAALVVYRATGSVGATAAGAAVLLWLLQAYLVPRPTSLSLLLVPLLMLALGSRATWWAAVPIVWVWAALHGSFVLGIGLVVLEAIRRRSPRLGGVAAASVVAASLTAHGPALWGVLLDFARAREALAVIAEWAPPDFTEPGLVAYPVLIAGVVVAAVRGRLRPADLVVVLPFLLFGLTGRRAVYPAALVIAPFAALALVRSPDRPEPSSSQGTGARFVPWATAALLVAVTAVAVAAAPSGPSPEVFPVVAAGEVSGSRVFHDDVTGGYLIYAAWPGTRVLVDDRAELYRDGYVEYREVRLGERPWQPYFAGMDWRGPCCVPARNWVPTWRPPAG